MGKVMDIVISTPMGNMDAKADFTIDGTAVSGVINFMGTDNAFSGGTIDEAGNIGFSGEFNSPVGKINFTITGTFVEDKLDAVAKTNMGNMAIKSK